MPVHTPTLSSIDTARALLDRVQNQALPHSARRLATSDETASRCVARQLESDQRLRDPVNGPEVRG